MSATLDDAAVKAEPAPDPFAIFDAWLAEATKGEPNDPNAMTLATVDATGLPDARTVLLKGHDARGFVFYTNLESAKAQELAQNPKAALLFHWKSLHRQVRIRGTVSAVSAEEADAYYASRALGSRIGAWASKQSRPLPDRATLEAAVKSAEEAHGENPSRPPFWSGFRVTPVEIEFWHDGAFRLHDRFLFTREGDQWAVARLYP
ncbi:MAG: pyridoxamine 5'-phosphate oxidase [Pseudomonadota bacterium]